MASATAVNVENPKIHSDLNSTPFVIEDASKTLSPEPSCGSSAETNKKSAVVQLTTTDVDAGGSVTDIQRKMKRAERFGVPVQFSEVEKRNSRADRFGTASIVNGVDSSKSAEELKRKARAERFGTVPSEPCDEESKKKARLARFGSLSKTDSVEEDKKKARAIRFSQLGLGSKANEVGDIEAKTAVPSKPGIGT